MGFGARGAALLLCVGLSSFAHAGTFEHDGALALLAPPPAPDGTARRSRDGSVVSDATAARDGVPPGAPLPRPIRRSLEAGDAPPSVRPFRTTLDGPASVARSAADLPVAPLAAASAGTAPLSVPAAQGASPPQSPVSEPRDAELPRSAGTAEHPPPLVPYVPRSHELRHVRLSLDRPGLGILGHAGAQRRARPIRVELDGGPPRAFAPRPFRGVLD